MKRTRGRVGLEHDGIAITSKILTMKGQYNDYCKSYLTTGPKRYHSYAAGKHSRFDFSTAAGRTEMLQRGRCSRGTRHARAPGTTLHAKKGRRVSQRFSADNRPLPGLRAPETRPHYRSHRAHHVRERSGFDRGRDEQCLTVRN